ncbi:MAG: hypothetical protein SH817_17705 [Leptospira sp.]|nr:hypothetical protein [Leptospira sp.]
MNSDFKEKLDQTIQNLSQDQNLTFRTTENVLRKASGLQKPANQISKFWIVAAAAIVIMYLASSNMITIEHQVTELQSPVDDLGQEVFLPEEGDDLWQETDNLILTTFGSK